MLVSCDVMVKETNELAGGKESPTKIETDEDIEIKKLDDSRKKLTNKEHKSTIE